VRTDEISRRASLVEYAEDDPGRVVAKVSVPFGTSALEPDRLLGAGVVEILLTRLLA